MLTSVHGCREFEATFDHNDIQLTARTQSRISVRPVADGHEDAASKGEMKLNLPIHVDGGASLSLLEKTELAENFRSLNHWQMRDIYTVPFDKDFSTKSTVPYDL